MEKSAETENQEAKNIIAKLAELSEETNMPITQENGQRCFGPPRDWEGAAPAKGICIILCSGLCIESHNIGIRCSVF